MPDNAAAPFRLTLIHRIFASFGLAVSPSKSDFTLRSRREHLGLLVDLRTRAFCVSSRKLFRLK